MARAQASSSPSCVMSLLTDARQRIPCLAIAFGNIVWPTTHSPQSLSSTLSFPFQRSTTSCKTSCSTFIVKTSFSDLNKNPDTTHNAPQDTNRSTKSNHFQELAQHEHKFFSPTRQPIYSHGAPGTLVSIRR